LWYYFPADDLESRVSTKEYLPVKTSSTGNRVADDNPQAMDLFQAIVREYPRKQESLIPIFQDLQGAFGYLSSEVLASMADYLHLPMSTVYGVATFYTQLHLERSGRHKITICEGTACHVRGATEIIRAVTAMLGIGPGDTTDDFEFSVESVACFGSCALAPVMVVNDKVYGNMTPGRAVEILEGLQ